MNLTKYVHPRSLYWKQSTDERNIRGARGVIQAMLMNQKIEY